MDVMEREPVRWWRTWRFRALAALPVILLVVRLAWGWYAGRALREEMAGVRARGEYAALDEVKLAEVPDKRNAWHYQTLAMQATVPGVDSPASSNLEYPSYPSVRGALHRGRRIEG
jgi:hypothetical protein